MTIDNPSLFPRLSTNKTTVILLLCPPGTHVCFKFLVQNTISVNFCEAISLAVNDTNVASFADSKAFLKLTSGQYLNHKPVFVGSSSLSECIKKLQRVH